MQSKIKFNLSATGPDLTAIVRLDDRIIWQGEPGHDAEEIIVEFNGDDDGDHLLEIEMQGKTRRHTRVDAQGNIIEDRVIKMWDFSIDDIFLGHTFTELAEYQHDFNGTGTMILDKFFDTMGCNGTVRLKFTTPIYLWLLENM